MPARPEKPTATFVGAAFVVLVAVEVEDEVPEGEVDVGSGLTEVLKGVVAALVEFVQLTL